MKKLYSATAKSCAGSKPAILVFLLCALAGCQSRYPENPKIDSSVNQDSAATSLKSEPDAREGDEKIVALERKAFDLMNQKRAGAGLKPLVWNGELAKVARKHSVDMAGHNFFSVQPFGGRTIGDQAAEFGIKDWKHLGRMVAAYTGVPNPVETAIERWLASNERRQYLFDSRWQETGVGIFVSKTGKLYLTQDFLSK